MHSETLNGLRVVRTEGVPGPSAPPPRGLALYSAPRCFAPPHLHAWPHGRRRRRHPLRERVRLQRRPRRGLQRQPERQQLVRPPPGQRAVAIRALCDVRRMRLRLCGQAGPALVPALLLGGLRVLRARRGLCGRLLPRCCQGALRLLSPCRHEDALRVLLRHS